MDCGKVLEWAAELSAGPVQLRLSIGINRRSSWRREKRILEVQSDGRDWGAYRIWKAFV